MWQNYHLSTQSRYAASICGNRQASPWKFDANYLRSHYVSSTRLEPWSIEWFSRVNLYVLSMKRFIYHQRIWSFVFRAIETISSWQLRYFCFSSSRCSDACFMRLKKKIISANHWLFSPQNLAVEFYDRNSAEIKVSIIFEKLNESMPSDERCRIEAIDSQETNSALTCP